MDRLSNYASSSPEVSFFFLYFPFMLLDHVIDFSFSHIQVLPEFLQVEAFTKLSSAIGKV